MDFKAFVDLALQISIISAVFGFGLKARPADLLYVVRRPRLLLRSVVAMFVCMPLIAVALARMFDFPQTVDVTLVALSISPVPPVLPRKNSRAGGSASFGIGLMTLLSIGAIALVPAALSALAWLVGRRLEFAPAAIAGLMMKATLAPLAAGVILRVLAPAMATRIEPIVVIAANSLMPLAVVLLIAGAAPSMWALIGTGSVLATVVFTLAGLAIGHGVGGPEPNHATVLALATACRHPALALAIAGTNFPEQQFGPVMLMYLLVSGVAGLSYAAWQRAPSRAAHAI
jgi:BASS family bile acid:Na+ symporter